MIGKSVESDLNRSCVNCRYYSEAHGPACDVIADGDVVPGSQGGCKFFNPTDEWLTELIRLREN